MKKLFKALPVCLLVVVMIVSISLSVTPKANAAVLTTVFEEYGIEVHIVGNTVTIQPMANLKEGQKVYIPAGVELIPAELAKTVTALQVLNGVESIDEGAFAGFESLSHVILSNGLTSIGANAFADTALNYIALPKSLETIGDGAVPETVANVAFFGPRAQWAELAKQLGDGFGDVGIAYLSPSDFAEAAAEIIAVATDASSSPSSSSMPMPTPPL